MKVFNTQGEIRLNGYYGTNPNMYSLWFGGSTTTGTWSTFDVMYINFSSSIPATYVGVFFWSIASPSGGDSRYAQESYYYGYGINAGGTSYSGNNVNENLYTFNQDNGGFTYMVFDGGNRRWKMVTQSTDYNRVSRWCVRIVSLYTNYITISYP